MKTINVGTDPITPTRKKLQYSLTRPKIFSSNIKNMQSIQINKISEIIKNNNFRDTNNIFFLKLTDKQRQKNKSSILPSVQRSKNQEQIISTLSFNNITHRQPIGQFQNIDENQQYQNQRYQISDQVDEKQDQYRQNTQRKYINEPDYYQKTVYIYKKKSLNSQVNFFKAFNRHEKSKTIDNSNCFNAELIGIQKQFSYKIESLKKIKNKKNKKSIQKSPKISIQNNLHLQSIRRSFHQCTSHEKCSKKQKKIIQFRKKQRKSRKQKFFTPRQTMKMIQTIRLKPKPKQQVFTPWKVSQQLLDSLHQV